MRKVGNGREFIPVESFRHLTSINAPHEAPTVSRKYSFFSTMNLIEALRSQNWLPVMAQEQRVRESGREGYQKHMIRFRQPGSILTVVGDIAPEIVLTNAHDARSAYVLMAGFFRLACLNGLIVSEGEFGAIRIKHLGYDENEVIEASYKVIDDVPRLTEKIGDYRSIILDPTEREIFAESALTMKYDADIEGKGTGMVKIENRTFSLPALLKPTRQQDADPTLWNTFNTIQEKLTKGNSFERTTRMVNGQIRQQTKVRGITGLNENVRVNRGLWHLMERMREIKTGNVTSELSVN